MSIKKWVVEVMKHLSVMPVLREMVPHGVMVIVHGATISVWHQEQVINLLIFTLTEAGLTTLNMLQHQEVWPIYFTCCRIQILLFWRSLAENFLIFYTFSSLEKCSADNTDMDCCSSSNKCDEYQGDCDNDGDCKSGLKCGNDNCPAAFVSSYDCCYNPKSTSKYCKSFRMKSNIILRFLCEIIVDTFRSI